MHDDAHRRDFLLEIGGRLDDVSQWLCESGFDRQVNASYAPTFLHGGSSTGKWIVMGINPGADDQSDEHKFKRSSPSNYVAFHEHFFVHFPRLRRNGKQPWWSKLIRVSRVLEGVVAPACDVPWSELHRSSSFVVQDLLPFHGRTSRTIESLKNGVFAALANATIEGVARSSARGVLVFSRKGFKLFRRHSRVHVMRDFYLDGKTSTGKARRIDGYVARIGPIPLVALDNELISQPSFPYHSALPLFLAELRRNGFIAGP